MFKNGNEFQLNALQYTRRVLKIRQNENFPVDILSDAYYIYERSNTDLKERKMAHKKDITKKNSTFTLHGKTKLALNRLAASRTMRSDKRVSASEVIDDLAAKAYEREIGGELRV